MFELARFARYALRFERALRHDDWRSVRACFEPDARYVMIGAPPFEGEYRGADEILDVFQRGVNAFDRRFDRRIPRVVGWPTSSGTDVRLRWRVRYVAKNESAILTGATLCRFRTDRIALLEDTMVAHEILAAVALCKRAGRQAGVGIRTP